DGDAVGLALRPCGITDRIDPRPVLGRHDSTLRASTPLRCGRTVRPAKANENRADRNESNGGTRAAAGRPGLSHPPGGSQGLREAAQSPPSDTGCARYTRGRPRSKIVVRWAVFPAEGFKPGAEQTHQTHQTHDGFGTKGESDESGESISSDAAANSGAL